MLRVTLLGEQLVHDDATGVARARSSRTTALVGYLACHAGRPQGRQLIAGLFWPDSTDAQALTNLRRELHHLRELLGDIEALKVTASDLTWCDDALCLVDVRTLQQAREQALGAAERGELADAAARAAEGIAAYGGSFLPGVYDDWADQLREELRLVCLELCDLVAEVGPRNRSVRTRLEAARKRIAVAPLEEVGYRELMALQADMGDRGGAINTYHHCAAILERELGVEPDPATRAALDRLMGRKPHLTKRTALTDDELPVRAVQPGAGHVPLVGRDAERDRLARLWTHAVAGTPVVAVVRGPAGVGKTEMLDDLVTRAESAGAQVAAARCVDSFGRLALAPVADWLRTPHIRNLTQVLDPVWRQEAHRLVPDIQAPVGPGSAGERAMVDAWQQHRFHEGLAQAFLNA